MQITSAIKIMNTEGPLQAAGVRCPARLASRNSPACPNNIKFCYAQIKGDDYMLLL